MPLNVCTISHSTRAGAAAKGSTPTSAGTEIPPEPAKTWSTAPCRCTIPDPSSYQAAGAAPNPGWAALNVSVQFVSLISIGAAGRLFAG